MRTSFTAVYIEAEDGWIVGYVEEIIGAHAQGKTIEETRRNLRDSLALMVGDNRDRNRATLKDYRVIRRERIEPAF